MDFGSGTWDGGPIGIPYNIVSGVSVNKYSFNFYYPDESDSGPYPLPAAPQIEWGSDHHILTVDTDDCTLYEVYDASFSNGQWSGGSGAIWDLDSNDLRPDQWTSADAAGLPILPGLARYAEISAGVIEHALRFTANCTANYYIWPARHKAQHGSCANPVPFGARFRLKSNYDISGFSPQAQILLQAFKTYGIVLADNGSDWYVSGAPSEDWDNDQLHELDILTGSNFEVVDTSGLMIDYNSAGTGFTISGNAGAAGVMLSYVDGTTKSVTSLANGSYAIAVPSGWSGTVTPSLAGVTFTPSSLSYVNVTFNQNGQNYAASVTLTGNVGVAGATLSYFDNTLRTVVADGIGNYTITVPVGWSGTVTPYKTGYTFTPVKKNYSSVQSNQITQNYIAQTCVGCVDVNVTIGGNSVGTYTLAVGGRAFPRYGINGGPVHVISTNAQPILTSQRAVFGNSFNSIVGYPGNQLTTEYWFTSLDDLGMITYLVIGNPSTTLTAHVDVYIAGNKMNPTPYAIAPGQRVFPRYGINGGPVQVVSDIPIFTSERTKYGNSFNEVLGYPANQLTTEYWFTSLDDLGMITYLVIGNPSTVDTALVDVYIAGNKMNITPYSIAPGQRVFPRYGINGGPVQVVSTNGVPIFTSERTKYGNSFNEVLGYPGNKLATEYWFTSLDDASMITYLVIGNPSTTLTAHVDVYINGVKQNVTPYAIAPGQRVFPRYGVNSGAVRVVSDIPIFTSERSKYQSSFNEILGLPTNQLTTDYWFTSLDDLGMATELVIAAP